MGNSDNVIGYIEYLSDDGKIIGYVTPFTDVDKFRKEILKAAEVGMPITPVVFPDKMSYGAVPFDLAAGTEQWWSIDSSDSAYWAVQENINAIRAAAGLSPLAMDGGLSAAADARCESFVAGGAFDHSGMTTRSEICAAGPIGSASSVCSYWQNSPAHYANITNASFTSMGVACWFCSTAEGQYTYWTVTFN